MQSEKKEEVTCDVKERDNIFVVEIELSEYLREEIQAIFHDGYLTITAKKCEPVMSMEQNYEQETKERQKQEQDLADEFKKAYYIGKDVSQENIRAAFHNGILKCMILKDVKGESKEPTEIQIM